MRTASSTHPIKDAAIFTAFDYLYRDAGNFKSYGTVLLEGRLTPSERQRIIDAMEAKEFFVAEQVSIPSLYGELFAFSGGKTSADHTWHSFSGFRETCTRFEGAIWGKASDFIEVFERVKQWDISLSPNYAM